MKKNNEKDTPAQSQRYVGAALQGFRSVGACIAPWALYPSFEKGFAGKWAAPPQHCQCVSRYLREAHDRTTRCCAPVPSALAMLAFSCQFPVRSRCSLLVASISDGFATGAYAQQAPAALIHHSSFLNRHWQCASLMSLKSLVSLISPRF